MSDPRDARTVAAEPATRLLKMAEQAIRWGEVHCEKVTADDLALVCRALLEGAQDRERLDAIEADEMQIATYERDLNGEVSETLWCVYDGNGEQHSARTLRTAIDAARSTEDAR